MDDWLSTLDLPDCIHDGNSAPSLIDTQLDLLSSPPRIPSHPPEDSNLSDKLANHLKPLERGERAVVGHAQSQTRSFGLGEKKVQESNPASFGSGNPKNTAGMGPLAVAAAALQNGRSNLLAAASSSLPTQGSCHQCKLRVPMSELSRCTSKSENPQGCKKKFCRSCLLRKYGIKVEKEDMSIWQCPACSGFCSCAVCMRKTMKGIPLSAKASCHQCKLKKPKHFLRHCTEVIRGRKCRKKYCENCLVRYGIHRGTAEKDAGKDFRCPACCGICTCASCERRRRDMTN
mmetsp:Transcript_28388/g.39502  ORF Transcript_28388/g.39502 Transcript_28388/m.39502 type:complete len:288 (-) Transcript_28388:168-1031(-)